MPDLLNRYKTQLKAVEFLNARGFKIKKSKFNDDLKRGLISRDEEGAFTESGLLAYAVARLDTTEKAENQAAIAAAMNKVSADAELKKVQAERQKLKLEIEQGKYIEREALEKGLAVRAQFFKQEIETFMYRVAAESIAIVGGDPAKIAELIKFWRHDSAVWMDAWSQEREFAVDGDVEDDIADQIIPEATDAETPAEVSP